MTTPAERTAPLTPEQKDFPLQEVADPRPENSGHEAATRRVRRASVDPPPG